MLKGKRVILRSIEEKDTDNIIRWRNQPFVRDKFIYRELFTQESHKKWLETMVGTGKVQQFMICINDLEEGIQPIGTIYLRDIDQKNCKAEFGIFIGERNYLEKGYGTEATQMLLKYAFQELKFHKIMLRVLASNQRAIECYKKAGFVEEGYFKDDVKIQGEYQDVVFMAVFE